MYTYKRFAAVILCITMVTGLFSACGTPSNTAGLSGYPDWAKLTKFMYEIGNRMRTDGDLMNLVGIPSLAEEAVEITFGETDLACIKYYKLTSKIGVMAYKTASGYDDPDGNTVIAVGHMEDFDTYYREAYNERALRVIGDYKDDIVSILKQTKLTTDTFNNAMPEDLQNAIDKDPILKAIMNEGLKKIRDGSLEYAFTKAFNLSKEDAGQLLKGFDWAPDVILKFDKLFDFAIEAYLFHNDPNYVDWDGCMSSFLGLLNQLVAKAIGIASFGLCEKVMVNFGNLVIDKVKDVQTRIFGYNLILLQAYIEMNPTTADFRIGTKTPTFIFGDRNDSIEWINRPGNNKINTKYDKFNFQGNEIIPARYGSVDDSTGTIKVTLPKNGSYGGGSNDVITVIVSKTGELIIGNGVYDAESDMGIASKTTSPLIIDLDGDGVHTTSLSNGVYFDLVENGFKIKTGWADAVDGLLARDLNGNGRIDSGGELFGNNTKLKNGKLATNGFEALKDLDDNSDYVIDASDSVWEELYLWVDANLNAYSEPDELVRLRDTDIVSIYLNYINFDFIDAQGNSHRQFSTVTRADDSTSEIVDVWFARDLKDSDEREKVEVTPDIAELPDIRSFSTTYSLHQAMMRDASGQLKSMVEQFAVEPNKDVRMQLVNEIIFKWTGVGNRAASQYKIEVIEKLTGEAYTGGTGPNATAILVNAFDRIARAVYEHFMAQTHLKQLYCSMIIDRSLQVPEYYDGDEESDYEIVFSDFDDSDICFDLTDTAAMLLSIIENNEAYGKQLLEDFVANIYALAMEDKMNLPTFSRIMASAGKECGIIIDYAMKNKIYATADGGTLNGTNGDDALFGRDGADSMYGKNGDDFLHGGKGNDTLTGGSGHKTYLFNLGDGTDTINNDDTTATPDILVFGRGIDPADISSIRNGRNLELSLPNSDKVVIYYYFSSTAQTAEVDLRYSIDEIHFDDGTIWASGNLLALHAETTVLNGTGGDDMLYGNDLNNTINGGTGNDLLHGGRGNDTLNGGSGHKTYLFNLGDGIDTINNYDITDTPDKLIFGEGINPEGVKNARNGRNLELLVSETDKVIISSYFTQTNQTASTDQNYTIAEVRFSDGTIWDGGKLANAMHANGASALYGSGEDNTLYGNVSTGTTIYGGGGNDSLFGGDANDTLYGNSGNNVLHGGKGSDWLSGGTGSNTYLFGVGDGIDTISNDDATGTPDRLVFGEGIKPEDVKSVRNGRNLELAIGGSTDKVIIYNYYTTTSVSASIDSRYAIDEIHFADGSIWDLAEHSGMVNYIYGTAGNDTLNGTSGNDAIFGEDGNDTINGGAGDDTLYGGAGNDTLNGGAGHKTYLFNLGDGIDTINNYDTTATPDKLVFGEGINPEDVKNTRNGRNLELVVSDVDKAIIYYYFTGTNQAAAVDPNYTVDEIHFGDGTVWTIGDLSILHANGTAALYGTSGDDALYGNEFDNAIYGGAGDDLLHGGPGNDTLNGGTGHKTYLFNPGDGTDTINNYDSTATPDKLAFGEGIKPEDVNVVHRDRNLELVISETDKAIISNYFSNTSKTAVVDANYVVDEIIFNDGPTWTQSDLANLVRHSNDTVTLYGTDGDDTLHCDELNNTVIHAGAGDDTLYGYFGNDTLNGDAGNDKLYGGAGNDTLNGGDGDDFLHGGTGNDTLNGGTGHKTYLFNLGDDVDTINNNDSTDTPDKLVLGEGINPEDVRVARNGRNMELIVSATDKAIISNYYSANNQTAVVDVNYTIDEIIFDDGAMWAPSDLTAMAKYANGTAALYGTAESETLTGNELNNTIYAGAGDDTIYGDDGNDNLNGDDGNDKLHGGAGNDTLNGGAGDDLLFGDDGNDTLNGGAGDDLLHGGTGNDTLNGGAGHKTYLFNLGDDVDTINNNDSTDTPDKLIFGEGINPEDVRVARNGRNLELIISATDKAIITNFYNSTAATAAVDPNYTIDEIIFADGTTWAPSNLTNSALYANGTATLYGTAESETLYGNELNNTIYGGAGDDIIYGFAGNDNLNGDAGDDKLYGGDGNDTLNGGAGDDLLHGGAGNDTLNGGAGHKTYLFNLGDNVDTINNYDSTDTPDKLILGEGINPEDVRVARNGRNLELIISATDKAVIFNYYSTNNQTAVVDANYTIDEIIFDDGTVWTPSDLTAMAKYANGTAALYGTEESETLYGNELNNAIYGGAGDDTIYGFDGNDSLYGDAGNDKLYGGSGNDTLTGGTGSKTYFFDLGGGVDTINNYDTTISPDRLVFGEGINPEDVSVARNGRNLELVVSATDKAIIYYYYDSTAATAAVDPNYTIDEIAFADGTVWTPSNLTNSALYANGTAVLYGTAESETLYGNEFNNTIYGGAGDDIIYGFAGNDNLNGDAGDDKLYGGDGNDTLNGGTGDDLLHGGPGNDTLNGGAGHKKYLFDLGDDVDTINNNDSTDTPDMLILGEGINPEDVRVARNGRNLELIISATDKAIISNYYSTNNQTAVVDANYTIDEIIFDDGAMWAPSDLAAMAKYANGTAALYGTAESETLHGNELNNTIYGGAGDDIIYGYAGNDTLNGDAGDDLLHGGPGNDTLNGGAGDDLLHGGPGNDTLNGGAGHKTYLFNLGDGVDTINNNDSTDTPDKLVLGEGINPEDVRVARNGRNLELIVSATDKAVISNYYSANNQTAVVDANYTIDEIIFDDGAMWAPSDLTAMAKYANGTAVLYGTPESETLYGNELNNTIYGGAGDDIIYGYAGNDTLNGDAGDDLLHGGPGNDTLNGGTGHKTYLFNLGDDVDTINNNDSTDTPDKLIFGEGINPEDVRVARNGRNLELIVSATDKAIIYYYYNSTAATAVVDPNYTIDEIIFADGVVWAPGNLTNSALYANGTATLYGTAESETLHGNELNNTIYGGAGDDIIYGYAGNDTLNGDAGNDELYGGEGNDTLNGGAGDDLLHGGPGNDTLNGGSGHKTYLFNLGDGVDTINNNDTFGTPDKLIIGEGISPEDVRVARNGRNLELIISPTDKAIIANYYSTTSQTALVDANYTIDEIIFVDGTIWIPSELTAMAKYANGTAVLYGTAERDTLYGNELNNTIHGGTGDDIIYGYAGNDNLNGDAGNDKLYGGDGNDTLNGGAGDDLLHGGPGNDTLNGGAGHKTYLFNLGDGVDTINNYDTTDTPDKLVFGKGIIQEEIMIIRNGRNLELIISDADKIIIYYYYTSTAQTAVVDPNYTIDEIVFDDEQQGNGVKVAGIINSYNPNNPTTIQLKQDGVEMYATTIPDEAGIGQQTQSFAFHGVAPGTYTLVITKPAHASFTVQSIVVGDEDVDLSYGSRATPSLMALRCGDVNGDGMINSADLVIFWSAANFNKSAAQAADPLCDLDGDGMINSADLAILWMSENYNKGAVVVP